MTLLNIAKLAGVSPATVSRVVNDYPRVAPGTVENVRRVIREARFVPRLRANASQRRALIESRPASFAFLVFGTSSSLAGPAFDHLLRGVSSAVTELGRSMVFAFVSDPSHVPIQVLQRRVDGLLLHGDQLSADLEAVLQGLPAVWLMSNHQRPISGDHVMPNNAVIGDLAASYLVRRGHRRLAVMNLAAGTWAFNVRSTSFADSAKQLGAEVATLRGPTLDPTDMWDQIRLATASEDVCEQFMRLKPRPTGLFVIEDRQVPAIDAALRRHGLRSGPGADVEYVSCNNEQSHLMSLSPPPATIDTAPESIGRRGVELLLARLPSEEDRPAGRIRLMIEPTLVESRHCQNIDHQYSGRGVESVVR